MLLAYILLLDGGDSLAASTSSTSSGSVTSAPSEAGSRLGGDVVGRCVLAAWSCSAINVLNREDGSFTCTNKDFSNLSRRLLDVSYQLAVSSRFRYSSTC